MADIILSITLIVIFSGFYYMLYYIATNKYIKEYKRSKVSFLGQTFSKKQKIIIIGIPLCTATVFAILYKNISEQKFIDFIKYGLASVVPNLIFIFILFYIYKDKFLKELGGYYSVAIFYILSLIIPFLTYFVLISLLFSGCQIPFKL